MNSLTMQNKIDTSIAKKVDKEVIGKQIEELDPRGKAMPHGCLLTRE
jgi:hypothetical protein